MGAVLACLLTDDSLSLLLKAVTPVSRNNSGIGAQQDRYRGRTANPAQTEMCNISLELEGRYVEA